MRKWTRAVFIARDYVTLRAQDFVDGDDVDLVAELPRLIVVLGVLVEAGVLEPDDWVLGAHLWTDKMRELSKVASVVEGRIYGRMAGLNAVERRIVANLVPRISQLVFEMAVVVLAHDVMAKGFSDFFESPPRYGRLISGRDVFVRNLRKTMNYLTPEKHLLAAKADLDAARKEYKRALSRVSYEKLSERGETGRTDVGAAIPVVLAVGNTARKVRAAYWRDKRDLFSTVRNESAIGEK